MVIDKCGLYQLDSVYVFHCYKPLFFLFPNCMLSFYHLLRILKVVRKNKHYFFFKPCFLGVFFPTKENVEIVIPCILSGTQATHY